jgi:hypothetical protein
VIDKVAVPAVTPDKSSLNVMLIVEAIATGAINAAPAAQDSRFNVRLERTSAPLK